MVSQEHRKLVESVELVRKEINERYADLCKLLGACTHEETEHNETFIEPCWQGGVLSGGFTQSYETCKLCLKIVGDIKYINTPS